jgi:hypothetical protein
VNELYHSKNKVYVKDKMEDLESIIGGVLAPKGRVHLVMSKPLTDKIKEVLGNLNINETAAKVAEIVDLQINRDYKLWPSNYLAYDILNKSSRFAVKYGDDVKDRLEERYKNTVKLVGIDNREIRDLFLTIYANPVANKLKNGFL